MTDPFGDLREPIRPVDPDPEFARRLRTRLERALARPGAPAATAYRHGDIVHVALFAPDLDRTRAFYAGVLGWTYLPDGRVDGSVPSVGFREGTVRMTCDYAVADLVATLDRVRDAGGVAGEIERQPWGTVAECADDQGTRIRLHEMATAAGPAPAGALAALTLEVPDADRAGAFHAAVLDWDVLGGRADGVAPPVTFSAGHDDATAVPVWTVPDVAAAVAAVRGHGGRASEPHRGASECVDDQGLRFGLLER